MTEENFDVSANASVNMSNAPTFSGKADDFDRFAKMVRYWKMQSPLKPEKLGAKLILCQTDEKVLDVLLSLKEDKVASEKGFDVVMEALQGKYAIDDEDMAWPAFDAFDSINRGKSESADQFVVRFDNAYSKARSYDDEFTMSDQGQVKMCLRRMNISPINRALILGNIKGKLTTATITKAIRSVFTTDVPYEIPKDNIPQTVAKDDASFVAPEGSPDDDVDPDGSAYWSKSAGKGDKKKSYPYNKAGVVCVRCGQRHESKDCRL